MCVSGPLTQKNGLFCGKLPENANFGPKTVFFWARVVTSKPLPPILQVVNLIQHVWQGRGAGRWVVQGRRTRKMPIFCPKMALKCQFSREKSVFWARVVSFKPPSDPIWQVLNSNKHVYRVWKPENWCFKAPSQRSPFLLKSGLKIPIWGKKTFFWAQVVSSSPPTPSLQAFDSKESVLQGRGARKYVFQGRPYLKKAIICQEMA